QIGRLGGLAVLDLEGLWTRYDDPEPLLAEVTELDEQPATRRLQAMYAEPISEDLIGRRIEEIARAGVTTAASLSPQRTARYAKAVGDAGGGPIGIRGRQGRGGGGRGNLRHPRHHGFGRARLRPGRAAQPEAVHLRARRPGGGGRLRDLPRRPAPDAPRRRRGAGRLRRRLRPHHREGARRGGAEGHPERPRGGGTARPPGR